MRRTIDQYMFSALLFQWNIETVNLSVLNSSNTVANGQSCYSCFAIELKQICGAGCLNMAGTLLQVGLVNIRAPFYYFGWPTQASDFVASYAMPGSAVYLSYLHAVLMDELCNVLLEVNVFFATNCSIPRPVFATMECLSECR